MYISYVKYRNKKPDFIMSSSVSCKVTKITNILCVSEKHKANRRKKNNLPPIQN